MSFATKKITDLTTLSVSTPSIEFVINDHGTDYKLLNSGIRITSSQISDLLLTNYATSPNTHALDDLTDVTLGTPVADDVLTYNGSAWIATTCLHLQTLKYLFEQAIANQSQFCTLVFFST